MRQLMGRGQSLNEGHADLMYHALIIPLSIIIAYVQSYFSDGFKEIWQREKQDNSVIVKCNFTESAYIQLAGEQLHWKHFCVTIPKLLYMTTEGSFVLFKRKSKCPHLCVPGKMAVIYNDDNYTK